MKEKTTKIEYFLDSFGSIISGRPKMLYKGNMLHEIKARDCGFSEDRSSNNPNKRLEKLSAWEWSERVLGRKV